MDLVLLCGHKDNKLLIWSVENENLTLNLYYYLTSWTSWWYLEHIDIEQCDQYLDKSQFFPTFF